MTLDVVPYGGWARNLRIANGDAELITTLEVGPRILSYRLVGGRNVFAEFADHLGRCGEPEWMARGGHRLWAAPEDPARTYFADNGSVAFEPIEGGFRLIPGSETPHGLQKEMDLKIADRGSSVEVVHRIRNVGERSTTLAPWALSVMAPGGVEIIPLPPKRPHPGAAKNAKGPGDFLAAFSMSVWPFTDFADDRWTFGSTCILLRQAARGPTKLGLSHREGWVGYLNSGTLFVKRFGYLEGANYPDGGCNFETFTNEDMLEVESLGPLVELGSGEQVEHVESWELFDKLGEVRGEADVEAEVRSRVGSG